MLTVAEVVGMEGDVITMQDIFLFEQEGYDENGKGKSVAILGYTDEGKPETSDRVAEPLTKRLHP